MKQEHKTNTMIAIPCLDTVPTVFMERLLALHRPAGTYIVTARNSLVYDSRNMLAEMAVQEGYDRILWIDSDMVFDGNLMLRLSKDLNDGKRFVSALCFTRKNPILPCIYSETGYRQAADGDRYETFMTCMEDYPTDKLFKVKGCGLAACMMEVSVIKEVYNKFGTPFSPIPGFGEDLSFCRKCDELGIEMWCDSSIKVGHIAQTVVTEEDFIDGAIL